MSVSKFKILSKKEKEKPLHSNLQILNLYTCVLKRWLNINKHTMKTKQYCPIERIERSKKHENKMPCLVTISKDR